jgi:hypothetical protein
MDPIDKITNQMLILCNLLPIAIDEINNFPFIKKTEIGVFISLFKKELADSKSTIKKEAIEMLTKLFTANIQDLFLVSLLDSNNYYENKLLVEKFEHIFSMELDDSIKSKISGYDFLGDIIKLNYTTPSFVKVKQHTFSLLLLIRDYIIDGLKKEKKDKNYDLRLSKYAAHIRDSYIVKTMAECDVKEMKTTVVSHMIKYDESRRNELLEYFKSLKVYDCRIQNDINKLLLYNNPTYLKSNQIFLTDDDIKIIDNLRTNANIIVHNLEIFFKTLIKANK